MEILFSIKTVEGLFVSNSLPFLLAVTDNSLDPDYHCYEEDLCSGLLGTRKAVSCATLADGVVLNFHRNCNVIIDLQLRMKEELKYSKLDFHTYEAYKQSISGVLKRLKENATDEIRKTQYGLISTISRGYDATATSALAAEI